jgi:hypothetical protein
MVFTYRENRVLLIQDGQLEFPNRAEISIALGDSPVLGDAVAGVTINHGSVARIQWNANTGRTDVLAATPFPPISLNVAVGEIQFELTDHAILAAWYCDSRDELLGRLGALHYVLPISLPLGFSDAPLVISTSGNVGGKRFEWTVESTPGLAEVIDSSDRDARILDAVERLPVLCHPKNQRLLAACSYFQRAVRLVSVGDGPAEFAGEAIINLAKCLEALFPGAKTRDAVREGLRGLGVSDTEIEGLFVRCQVLRSELDAAHVRMATLSSDERRAIQIFYQSILGPFRTLLNTIFAQVADGTHDVAPYEERQSTDDDLAMLISSLAFEGGDEMSN